ncbi:MAG: hypothetical protein GF313_04335, partial [Caldithrix sp.]|nr:hypothetical protein [Caldithrix sp.]
MLTHRSLSAFIFFMFLPFLLHADVWTTSHISTDTIWLKNNSSGDGIYIIDLENDSLIVDSSATLTIEPGVTVKFHDDIKLLVYGSLNAAGMMNDSIIIKIDDAAGSAAEWGGMSLISDSLFNTISYCRIENADKDLNLTGAPLDAKNGGAIFCGSNIRENTVISHNLIRNNRAREGGGAIFCTNKSSPVIRANTISNNTAAQYGGGIGARGTTLQELTSPEIINNKIIYNTANGSGGGGIGMLSNTNIVAKNNLIYGNSSPSGNGGGIYSFNNTNFGTITNTVIWSNTADQDDQVFGTIDIQYSNVQGSFSGEGNINSDPQFNDTSNDDFHFEANSPLVDAGTNSDAPLLDYDGNDRPFDGDRNEIAVTDMGPYEYLNTPPTITSTPVTEATEDQLYTYQIVAEDNDVGESLIYHILQGPTFLSIDSSSGLLSGTPQTDAESGQHTVEVDVEDLNKATDTQLFTLTVTAVNDTPQVSDIPDQTIDEGTSFAEIDLNIYVNDEESNDDAMEWTYSGNNELSVEISSENIATITYPDEDWFGNETITFTATDPGGLQDNDAAVFTVNNINDNPVANDDSGQLDEDDSLAIDVKANDNDVDNDDLTVQSVTNPANGTADIQPDNTVMYQPDADFFGADSFTYTVV